jgi:hypothetical protein
MKTTDMSEYMRLEMWVDRIRETIVNWEKIQKIEVPQETKESITRFMRGKVKKGITKGTLMRTFMQIAVSSLLFIKVKGIK